MKPEWRTTTVIALCRRMLDGREFDALPILADALQDAGCTDAELLAQCQDEKLSRVRAERLVNLVYSVETADAVRWLEQFVRDINYDDYQDENEDVGTPSNTNPHDYEFAIGVGRSGVEEKRMHFGSDAGACFFWESDDNMRTFFRNWSLITGVPVSDEDQGGIDVRCAC